MLGQSAVRFFYKTLQVFNSDQSLGIRWRCPNALLKSSEKRSDFGIKKSRCLSEASFCSSPKLRASQWSCAARWWKRDAFFAYFLVHTRKYVALGGESPNRSHSGNFQLQYQANQILIRLPNNNSPSNQIMPPTLALIKHDPQKTQP